MCKLSGNLQHLHRSTAARFHLWPAGTAGTAGRMRPAWRSSEMKGTSPMVSMMILQTACENGWHHLQHPLYPLRKHAFTPSVMITATNAPDQQSRETALGIMTRMHRFASKIGNHMHWRASGTHFMTLHLNRSCRKPFYGMRAQICTNLLAGSFYDSVLAIALRRQKGWTV